MTHPGLVYVVNSDIVSGGELYAVALARAFSGLGIDVEFVVREGSPVSDVAARTGIATRSLSLPPKLGRRTALRAVRELRSARALLRDLVVEVGGDRRAIVQYKLEELLWPNYGNPPIVIEHGPLPEALLRVPAVKRRLLKLYSRARCFAVSEVARESMRRLGAIDVDVLPPAVDRQRVYRARRSRDLLRGRLLTGRARRLVLYAGRLSANKGVAILPQLAARLGDAWTTIVLGEGAERSALLQRARVLGVADRFFVLGRVPDALPYLAAADVVVHPTRDPGEGRPLVVLEALACGTPVVGNGESVALRLLRRDLGSPRSLVLARMDAGTLSAEVAKASGLPRTELPIADWEDVARFILGRI